MKGAWQKPALLHLGALTSGLRNGAGGSGAELDNSLGAKDTATADGLFSWFIQPRPDRS